MAVINIGTCSWKYDSWRGIIYSQREDINYLKEYAVKYSTVEVDQWFWSLQKSNRVTLPKPTDVLAYAQSVPENFKFSVKVPNSITLTHHYQKNKAQPLIANPHFLSADVMERFIELLSPIHSNLGPLMFQFEYLNKQKMPGINIFLEKLSPFFEKLPKDFLYALEIRNPNYLELNYFQFLKQAGIAHIFLEGYYMPSVFNVYKDFSEFIKGTSIVRLHGPDRQGIEKLTKKRWDKIVIARDNEITVIAQLIREMAAKDVEVYLNINNHYEGCAPKTIQKIEQLL